MSLSHIFEKGLREKRYDMSRLVLPTAPRAETFMSRAARRSALYTGLMFSIFL